MNKMLMALCFGIAAALLSSCAGQMIYSVNSALVASYVNKIVATPDNITIFIEKLELNGFVLEEIGETSVADCFLSVGSRHFEIGHGHLTIYEFYSHEEMEKAAALICKSGFSIERPDPYQEGYMITTLISWANDPYWFKIDSLIVLYVGEDKYVVNFLMENLVFFAGYDFRDNSSRLQTPPVRGFFGTSGTVVSVKPYDDAFFTVLIYYVYRYHALGECGYAIMPGTQVQMEFFIAQDTLLLMEAEIEAGMEVTVYEFIAEPGEPPAKRTAFLILSADYAWVHRSVQR